MIELYFQLYVKVITNKILISEMIPNKSTFEIPLWEISLLLLMTVWTNKQVLKVALGAKLIVSANEHKVIWTNEKLE